MFSPDEAVSPVSAGLPVDCADWSLGPLRAGPGRGVPVKDPPRLPMGEGALVLAGLTYWLSFGNALTTMKPACHIPAVQVSEIEIDQLLQKSE